MCTIEEGSIILEDGHRLYTKNWKPTTNPKAVLLFIHGFSDHLDTHYTFFPTLAAHSIQTHAFDQRGWGRSVSRPSEKGLSGPTTTVLNDITQVLSAVIAVAAPVQAPVFLMGHSMGGGEVLQYAARGPENMRAQIRGYLAEAPYIALHPSTQPSRLTVYAGRLVAKIAPRQQMVQRVNRKYVSRDEQVVKDNEEDTLCHDTGTLEGLAGMLDRGHELNTGAVMPVSGSYWIGHGDADKVTSWDASKSFFERLPIKDKVFRTYEGFYHKLHVEPEADKARVVNDIIDWILARVQVDPHMEQSKL